MREQLTNVIIRKLANLLKSVVCQVDKFNLI